MPNVVTIIAFVFAALGAAFLVAALAALRRRRFMRSGARLMFGVALFAIAGFFAALAVGVQGYRALTREEVAAIVETEPIGGQRFHARLRLPDGRVAVYTIAGDELYVDAHILKWKPIANLVGLHTAYELDRIGGRYRRLHDEQHAPRSVYGISDDKTIDLFDLRRRYAVLAPLVDAEYGSATFVPVDEPARLEVRVSTTGLLIRRVRGGGSLAGASE